MFSTDIQPAQPQWTTWSPRVAGAQEVQDRPGLVGEQVAGLR
jgi:hypothetical protein